MVQANIQVENSCNRNSTTQFVSGPNGNLEISGSNFHLDSNVNVKVSGETISNVAILQLFFANVATPSVKIWSIKSNNF